MQEFAAGKFHFDPSLLVYLFDHLSGCDEHRRRDREAERLRGLEVDRQLGLRDLLDRQVGGLLTLDNPSGVDASLTVRLGNAAPIAHQAASGGELPRLKDRCKCVAESQVGELFAPANEEWIIADHQPTGTELGQPCENNVEIVFATRIQDMELKIQSAGRRPWFSRYGLCIGIGWIDKKRNDLRRRY